MKFRVERDEFADAVAWTARTLPVRPPVPVLAGLLLDVSADALRLSGFDYEVSAEATLSADTDEAGRALVSGRLLADITRSLPAAPVQLATDGARVVLTCGSARFTLPTLAVEDYPALPPMPPAAGRIASDAFAAAVGQVAVAAGRDDTLPVLTGIRVEIDGEQLTLAATDRYRLAVRDLKWRPEAADNPATALIPAKTLADAAKTLASTGAEVAIALGSGAQGEGMVGFAGGSRRTTTRLLEGEFPKYRSLIPDEFASVAHASTGALIEAVKRVSLVATRNTPIRLTFDGEELVLDAGAGDEAQASEAIEASYDGEGMTIAFNPGYLLDGLSAIDSDVARLAFNGPIKPAVITGKETEADYRYLLMPVRLSG
ncbi:MAG: DNA polymerase III subunit beta [Mycobacteriales bacterium]|nr:DNA polymerase III subunit beta [Frankia sp.]